MDARALSNLLAIARVGVASTSGVPEAPSTVRAAPPPAGRPARASEPPVFRQRGQVVLRAGRQPPTRAASATAADLLNVFEDAEEEGVGLVDPAVDRDPDRAPTPRWYANSGKAHTYEVMRVDANGTTTMQELKRRELLRSTKLPARDLRRIDPALTLTTSAPSLLVSDEVLLINLGQVRLIVAQDHALLFEPKSQVGRHFLSGLLFRLRAAQENAAGGGGEEEGGFVGLTSGRLQAELQGPSPVPFELEVVEAALLEATSQLDTLLVDASGRTTALLRVLPQRLAITAEVLEELRLVKQSLVELDSRAGAIRSMLLEVLDDPEDIRGMRLAYGEGGAAAKGLVPPPSAEQLEDAEDEVENILEYYLQRCETAHGEAERLLENTRDLEESISVSLSARRFEVNKLELSLSIVTFATAVGALVAGIFGMNLRNRLELSTAAFYGTATGILVGCICLCVLIFRYTRQKRIL